MSRTPDTYRKLLYVEILTHNPFERRIQNVRPRLRDHKVRRNARIVEKGALRPRPRATVSIGLSTFILWP